MKSKSIKFIPFIFILILLTSCSVNEVGKDGAFGATYPSQMLTGEVYVLKSFEKIDGNIVGFGTTLIIEEGAAVLGDINLFASDLEIGGRVSGDINLFGGKSHILRSGIVTGSVNKIANDQEIETGAVIYGEINTFQFSNKDAENYYPAFQDEINFFKPRTLVIYQIIRNIFLLFSNILVIYLFNAQTSRIRIKLEQDLLVSWLIGLLTFVAIPIVSLVLVISICLSPIGLILMLALMLINLWGWAISSYYLGSKLAHWFRLDTKDIATVTLGTVFLGILFILTAFIPFLSFFLSSVISFLGTGAIVFHFFTRSNQKPVKKSRT